LTAQKGCPIFAAGSRSAQSTKAPTRSPPV
jgi:hypothetical protein